MCYNSTMKKFKENNMGTAQSKTKKVFKKAGRKLNKLNENHVAVAAILLLFTMCVSSAFVTNTVVHAEEIAQPLTPETVVLEPVKTIEEKIDTDKDGLEDKVDACIDEKPTTDEDKDGCEDVIDTDKDGVEDADDKCLEEKPTVDEDKDGCEDVIDTDNDGIEDEADACVDEKPSVDADKDGCEDEVEVAEVTAEETPVEAAPVVEATPAPTGGNLVGRSGTDMSYMHADLSSNTDRYSNGWYCGADNVAYEEGTDAVLVAMGSQFEMGMYYEVQVSNYGTMTVKKVEEKQDAHTENGAGYVGQNGDSIELMVCDGFDPNGHGKSKNLGMYVESIYSLGY